MNTKTFYKTDDSLKQIIEFVKEKHKGQVRKYTGEPYHTHVFKVGEQAKKMLSKCNYADTLREVVRIAGYCHDLIEDTDCTSNELKDFLTNHINEEYHINLIIQVVDLLTDEYTSEKYPHLNRKTRKELEVERKLFDYKNYKMQLPIILTQIVKICDMVDNTSTIAGDKKFAKTYLDEKMHLLYSFSTNQIIPNEIQLEIIKIMHNCFKIYQGL